MPHWRGVFQFACRRILHSQPETPKKRPIRLKKKTPD
jgi:hypothetical protein